MKKKLVPVFLFLTALSLACNFMTNLAPSGTATGEAPLIPSNIQANGFSAQATSPVSVQLSWPTVNGAEKYLIDVRIGDEEFIPLVELPAGQTSFEDFPVPRNSEIIYRLRTVTAFETDAGETATVNTPLATPNPITVKAKSYEPVLWTPPTPDPNNPNIDPSAFYPPGFDPNNPEAFDPSSMLTTPSASQIIGPQGGAVTVTSPDGVTYTLNVPEGAVEGSIIITLTPIESIENLPFDGKMLAAVKIEPEGFILDAPATLTILLPDGTPALTDGLFDIGFGYQGEGSEFHLVPRILPSTETGADSSAGLKLASLSRRTDSQTSGQITVNIGVDLINTGLARWPAKIMEIAKDRAPSDPGNQASIDMAVIQVKNELEELEPLPESLTPKAPDPHVVKQAQSRLDKANTADSWPKFMEALYDFQLFLEAGNDIPGMDKINNKTWDKLVEQAKKLLDKNKGKCFSANDSQAQELVERLWEPKGKFSEMLSLKFRLKYKEEYVKEMAENMVKKCKVSLNMVSTISYQQNGVTTSAAVKMTIRLKWKFDRIARESFLTGSDSLTYTLFDMHGLGCSNTNFNTLNGSTFTVNRLSPIYDKDVLINFGMSNYSLTGKQTEVTTTCDGRTVKGGTLGGAQGDIWGGLFVLSHAPDQMVVDDWKVYSTTAKKIAEKEYRWSKTPALGGGGNITEQTTFTLLVGQ